MEKYYFRCVNAPSQFWQNDKDLRRYVLYTATQESVFGMAELFIHSETKNFTLAMLSSELHADKNFETFILEHHKEILIAVSLLMLQGKSVWYPPRNIEK